MKDAILAVFICMSLVVCALFYMHINDFKWLQGRVEALEFRIDKLSLLTGNSFVELSEHIEQQDNLSEEIRINGGDIIASDYRFFVLEQYLKEQGIRVTNAPPVSGD